MHGRQRSEYKAMQRDPKTAEKLAKKAEQWFTLTAQINDENALALTEKLLTVNPDPLYLWNQRRQQATRLEWDTESSLTATALRNNPKAYGAWFHRKWCLIHLLPTGRAKRSSVYQQELGLTVQFLERDERNFHCWNYRRFVISLLLHQSQPSPAGTWEVVLPDSAEKQLLMGAQITSSGALKTPPDGDDGDEEDKSDPTDWIAHEWDFTRLKIQQNFSNFSAFHYRSKLYALKQPPLAEELELVENAIFTEPDDQTAWWYQSFLLRQSNQKDSEEGWESHVSNLRELAEEVPHSKWVVLGLLNCCQKLCEFHSASTNTDELVALCQKVAELDPDRKGRYARLMQQLTKS